MFWATKKDSLAHSAGSITLPSSSTELPYCSIKEEASLFNSVVLARFNGRSKV